MQLSVGNDPYALDTRVDQATLDLGHERVLHILAYSKDLWAPSYIFDSVRGVNGSPSESKCVPSVESSCIDFRKTQRIKTRLRRMQCLRTVIASLSNTYVWRTRQKYRQTCRRCSKIQHSGATQAVQAAERA